MLKFLICVFFIGYVSAEKVIIIGAGAAGIAAASRLLDNNITDFRILEAENRIGGRIHSFHFGNAIVDLGAQYVHGEKGNIAYAISKEYVKPEGKLGSVSVFHSGHKKTGDDLKETVDTLRTEAWKDGRPNVSVGEAFLERFNATVLTKYKNNPEMLRYAKDMIRSAECSVLGLEGAFSWFKPTSTSDEYLDCEGDQALSWNGLGYKTILDILLKNFPNKTGHNIDKSLSLNKTVTKITLTENSVNLKTADGKEYIADHVIFTPSLGVLKHDHKKLFEPELSADKIAVIENMGFDGVMKVILEFPNSWWGVEEYFIFVWSEEEKKNLLKEIPFGPVRDGDHWLSWFYLLGIAPNNPNVLIGWIAGPMVPEIERLTKEEMKNGTVRAIKKFLGNDFNVTEPLKVIHSKWCNNPLVRGTYSYESVELKKRNIHFAQRTLFRPIPDRNGVPRILFAGEATSTTRTATVDGAIDSGFREGDRLVKILKI